VALRTPSGPGLRDDSGVYDGYEVPIHYDPLISKLAAWGADRTEALDRMRRAVAEYTVLGIRTTLPFFGRVLRDPEFLAGEYDTGYVARLLATPAPAASEESCEAAVIAAAVRAVRERQAARLQTTAAPVAASAWRTRSWRDLGGER
jgi:acetyl-CoA carboxylase, biotin carboxylase subunit